MKTGWIELTDKLPESEDIVLVTVKDGTPNNGAELIGTQVHEAWFVNDSNVSDDWLPYFVLMDDHAGNKLRKEVIAWMPMPEPYRAQGGLNE